MFSDTIDPIEPLHLAQFVSLVKEGLASSGGNLRVLGVDCNTPWYLVLVDEGLLALIGC